MGHYNLAKLFTSLFLQLKGDQYLQNYLDGSHS